MKICNMKKNAQNKYAILCQFKYINMLNCIHPNNCRLLPVVWLQQSQLDVSLQ